MSTSNEETKIPVKFLVDKVKKKVIFAEADADFLDTLFSFLTLPMSTIVRLLQTETSDSQPISLGSLTTLYQGLANLDPKYFCTNEYGKNMLLKSRNSSAKECCRLKVNIDDSGPLRYFICNDLQCSNKTIALFSSHKVATCACGKQMNKELVEHVQRVNGGDCVFFTQFANYNLSDDLRVMENLPNSSIDLLNESGTKYVGDLEEKILSFGSKEFIRLLKCSLCSKTPLTDLFFGNSEQVYSEQVYSEQVNQIKTTSDSKKVSLKLMVTKSTKKILYGVAGEDFLDLIFSFLAMPLGSVLSLLNGNTNLGCIDNLYKSISKPFVSSRFRSSELMNKLVSPCLASAYLCKNSIFSLTEENTSNLYYCCTLNGNAYVIANIGYTSSHPQDFFAYPKLKLKDPKSDEVFFRGPRCFMVTDDLVVTHLSSISSILSLSCHNVHFSEVDEQVVNIGIAEALSILKASLHSKSALNKGINLNLKTIK